MRSLILGSVLLAGSIFDLAFSASTASPKAHRLTRRANPSLDSSFGASDTETQQINNAFFDAIELASYAVVADIDTNGPIFAKYFNLADKGTVRSVFMSIMGNPADVMNPGTTGNDLLGKITVTRSDPDGDCAADATLMAQLAQYDTDTPLLEVCPGAGFGHGAIGKDPNKVVCENLGDTVSWRMETLGSILLHEYTHYTNLVVPPLSAETDDLDDGFGPINTRALDKSLAKTNADSYSWYANVRIQYRNVASECRQPNAAVAR
ncbi:Metallopeptidase, catalytic domain [Lasallia pustulata]|uniref:Metallopeptidase, catalytic domain n=1 Tax=Lasallia pustulata TaxID=136370 RepID=A0A1W5D396_9LECA|nr:Metallopeptidase, catalytic domain [Lasallia pustulata]